MTPKTEIVLDHALKRDLRPVREGPNLVEVGFPRLTPIGSAKGSFFNKQSRQWMQRVAADPEFLLAGVEGDEPRLLLEHLREQMQDPDFQSGDQVAISETRIYGAFRNGAPSRAEKALDELCSTWLVESSLFGAPDHAVVEAWFQALSLNIYPSPLADLRKLTGDAGAALLMNQILYWQSRRRIRRGGQLVIAKTRQEWMAETGITRHQYNRALGLLKDLGLIETCRATFRCKTVTHLRATTYIAINDLDEIQKLAQDWLELSA